MFVVGSGQQRVLFLGPLGETFLDAVKWRLNNFFSLYGFEVCVHVRVRVFLYKCVCVCVFIYMSGATRVSS